jgi:hypothetical protein
MEKAVAGAHASESQCVATWIHDFAMLYLLHHHSIGVDVLWVRVEHWTEILGNQEKMRS